MTQDTDQDRVWKLMEDIKYCMLVSHDGAGDTIRARPMDAHPDRAQDAILFLTDIRNHKDDEVEINDNVCLTFADNSGYRFVSVSGTANVMEDRAKIHELWSSGNHAFWESADDPNIRILKVRPHQAEFWDSPGKVVTAVKMAAAAMTGKTQDLGDNRKVTL